MNHATKRSLRALFVMVIAGSTMGAKGLSCGPCNDIVTVVPRLPPDNPDGSPPPPFDPEVVSSEECVLLCGQGYVGCEAIAIEGEPPAVQCTTNNECGAGRRPRGLRRADVAASRGAAAWLARAAHLEAASVRAFASLAGELATHGAPETLLRRARSASREEARHARVMGALARRRGATVPAVRVRATRPRSMAALAIENAVEGCVAETFAALVAQHQAERAADPRVRHAMRRIAADEASHAALAHAVDAWIAPRLTPAERRRVARARARAAERLSGWSVDPAAASELGLPGDREGRAFAAALGTALGWSRQPT